MNKKTLPKKVVSLDLEDNNPLYMKYDIKTLPVFVFNIQNIDKLYSLVNGQLKVHFDIFGTCFFLLSRYEEAILRETDEHGRFPYKSSILNKYNLVKRPIVNEYVEFLWFCMKKLWPSLERKKHVFEVKPTHDVDNPFLSFFNVKRLIRSLAVDFVKRKEFFLPFVKTKSWIASKITKKKKHDLYNNFDQIMNIDEKYGLTSTYYFMSNTSNCRYDGNYDIKDMELRNLLKKVHEREHEIGLHSSYETYLDPVLIKKEFDKLKEVCEQEDIFQEKWGARQHYLRLKVSETFSNLEKAGLNYDSSLYFAESPGFRSSICYPYFIYDVINRRMLNLVEKPLLIMEGSLLESDYLGANYEEVTKISKNIIRQVKMYKGKLTFLWHNDYLIMEKNRKLYENFLSEALND